MPTPLISPNLHVVLIHYPLGIFIAGVMIEFFSFLYRRSMFRAVGRWMIMLGALSAIPATFAGIYAMRQVVRVDMDTDLPWVSTKAASPVLAGHPEVWQTLHQHMLFQSIATGVAALVVVIWLGASDKLAKSLYWVLMPILLADAGLMIAGSHLGGISVYHNSVGVGLPSPPPPTGPLDFETRLDRMVPKLELHTTMAGAAIAIALLSIGLSFRKLTVLRDPSDEPIVTGDPEAVYKTRKPPTSMEMVRTFNPDLELHAPLFLPAGRFWMLTFLLSLGTFLGGLWVFGILPQMISDPGHAWPSFTALYQLHDAKDPQTKHTRQFAHAVAGSAIVLLPILLATLARFAPRQKLMLLLGTLLLTAAVTLQVWEGVLLMYDTDHGKLLYWNPPAAVENP